MKVIKCEPMKEAKIVDIDSSLESLQKEVCGYIESYYPYDDFVCIVCNDEGKLN